jgi:hypothetical protein
MLREGCLLGECQAPNAYTQNKAQEGRNPLTGGLETSQGRI